MSVISNRHTFAEFTSTGKNRSVPYTGQRLAKVGYKEKSGKQSVCVSIPMLDDSDVDKINQAFPVDFRKRAEDFQNGLIRSLYESGKSAIETDEINVTSILAYLESENNAGRLSAEKVKEWFTGEFADTAMVLMSEKYKTEDETILQQKANAWLAAFVALTGNSPIHVDRLNQLRSMTDMVQDDDVIGNRVKNKVEGLLAELASLDDI